MFWLAQTPVPTPEVIVEQIATAPTSAFTVPQMILLVIYFLTCLGLILCVTFQTSKSEGLMQQSMAAAAAPTGKGKMTGDERLANLTNNMAYAFLFLSVIVAYSIKVV